MPDTPRETTRFDVDQLRRAVGLYLDVAYLSGVLPPAVQQRLNWAEDVNLATLLDRPPFERAKRPDPGEAPIYALRLGNQHYPHMKLQVQPWPHPQGYILSVNAHDQVLHPHHSQDPAWRELRSKNQKIKEAIEEAWKQAGLPIFLTYLEGVIADYQHPGGDPPAGAR